MIHGRGAPKDTDWIKASAEEEGIPVETIEVAEKPSLDDWLYQVYSLFNAVSRSRSFGMGGALPVDLPSIRAAFDIFGILEDDWPEWTFMLQEMDAKWLALSAPKPENKKAEA